jgi:hypothetical protein
MRVILLCKVFRSSSKQQQAKSLGTSLESGIFTVEQAQPVQAAAALPSKPQTLMEALTEPR